MTAPHPHSHLVPLSSVMAQIGAELRMLVAAFGAVEAAVDAIVAESHRKDARTVRDLQNLDLLAQSLQALATFTEDLSASVPQAWQVDTATAARSLTLAALARRLRLSSIAPAADHKPTTSELEMFD